MINPFTIWLTFVLLAFIGCLFKPNAARVFIGFFFIVMAIGIHIITVIVNQVLYRDGRKRTHPLLSMDFYAYYCIESCIVRSTNRNISNSLRPDDSQQEKAFQSRVEGQARFINSRKLLTIHDQKGATDAFKNRSRINHDRCHIFISFR
jgi:hypothetical protein